MVDFDEFVWRWLLAPHPAPTPEDAAEAEIIERMHRD